MLTAEIRPDGIAMLRLDQPERRNALSIAMRDAISDTLEAWTTDDRVRVVARADGLAWMPDDLSGKGGGVLKVRVQSRQDHRQSGQSECIPAAPTCRDVRPVTVTGSVSHPTIA